MAWRELTDWRAGCGKSARPVRREGWRTTRHPYPYSQVSLREKAEELLCCLSNGRPNNGRSTVGHCAAGAGGTPALLWLPRADAEDEEQFVENSFVGDPLQLCSVRKPRDADPVR